MPTNPEPLTLAEVVRRAVAIVDPDDDDAAAGDFQRAFEDADEPIRGVDDVESRIADVLSELDPAANSGTLAVAATLVVYLAHRRDEAGASPDELLHLATRAEWHGEPPEPVAEWLADRGIGR